MPTVNNTTCCHWCGVSLAFATKITYLNGNLPVCDLCLMKATQPSPPVTIGPLTFEVKDDQG